MPPLAYDIQTPGTPLSEARVFSTEPMIEQDPWKDIKIQDKEDPDYGWVDVYGAIDVFSELIKK